MKWSPPRIADRQSVNTLPASVAAVVFLSGCASIPSLPSAQGSVSSSAPMTNGQYTDEEKIWLSQMPAVPSFDETRPVPTPIAASPAPTSSTGTVAPGAGTNNMVAQSSPVASGSLNSSPVVSNPATVAATGSQVPAAEQKGTSAVVPAPPKEEPETVASQPSTSAQPTKPPVLSLGAEQKPTSAEPTRVALAESPAASDMKTAQGNRKSSTTDSKKPAPSDKVNAPVAFSWTKVGKSSGGQTFEMAQSGEDGYRTLVVGSVGGHDPAAIAIVDQLAQHLHDNSLILGGYDTTFIRTLNPDGMKSKTALNSKGQYINHGFPKAGDTQSVDQPVEAAFLMSQLKQLQPQRVLHIRTIEGDKGLIASSGSCQKVAQETAQIIGFRYVALPEKAVAGSFERYLASRGSSEIITLAIPAKTKTAEAWELYRDTVLNLLQRDDLTTRELARGQEEKASADRRNGK